MELTTRTDESKNGFGLTASGWSPLPGPQSDAYDCEAFETLYGGAAGGGKSDLLLGVARYEHYKTLLLRRAFPDLERSLIIRSYEIYGDVSRYNGSKHVWNIDGRRIEFGHLEYEKTVHQYQSAQYDLIGFDELTQFTKSQYEYMLSRARTIRKGQRVRVIACTNPGGEGNDWVMERWAAWLSDTHPNPALPGELRWYKRAIDNREVETDASDPDAVSRTFIPARLADNPYLGDDYRRILNLMPEPLRSQLLSGDWRAGLTDDAYQVIPRAWVKLAQSRWQPRSNPGVLTRLGVDVARGGDDQTVLSKLYTTWIAELEKYPGRSTPDGQSVAGLIVVALVGSDATANIDVIGIGASAFDIAKEKVSISPVNFAQASDALDASGQLRFVNKRAEYYWRAREALDPVSGMNLAFPPDPELLGDLIAPRWSMQTNGIKIESKEDIKKRINRSPDCGDSVVLVLGPAAASLPEQPTKKSKWLEPQLEEADGSKWRRY